MAFSRSRWAQWTSNATWPSSTSLMLMGPHDDTAVIADEGRLCRPENLGQHAAGGWEGPGGGLALPPLMSCQTDVLSD